MPRDIPVGNGDLLLTFDADYRIRDLYYPRVGRLNHTLGHVQRFGVWADGMFAWIEDEGWTRDLRYKADTLVTEVRLTHKELALELVCTDAVDFHEPIYFRKCVVRDLSGKVRDVRVFFHVDLSIGELQVGNTANYDPQTNAVVLYKDDYYFLINACDQRKCGIDHWAIGAARFGGKEGTWKDAEDGQLGRNAISQGSVDATVGFNLQVPPNGESYVTAWIACGRSYEEIRERSQRIWHLGPDRMLGRTEAYWRLWVRKEPIDTTPLPENVRDLFYRSQLICRTQIDNRGAIIAANDTDITHFAGDHYSYCWMRDGALVAYSLIRTGQSELARGFFRFAGDCVESQGYFLHKYTPEGELASSWHPWMIDGQRVLPIQQDETALVTWALRKHFEVYRDVEFVKPLYRKLVTQPADWMLEHRDHNGLPKPSWDLWEERRGVHTFTVCATIGALRAAAEFADDFGEPDKAAAYREAGERMTAALKRHLHHPEQNRFARMAVPLDDGSYRLDMTADMANFALFAFDALDTSDATDLALIEAEMTALEKILRVHTEIGGLARYERDYYHQIETKDTDRVPGNPWVICTLWRAQWKIRRARDVSELRTALDELSWAAERALPSGVLAEQFHPRDGSPISVSPLTWSHSTFVLTCCDYIEKLAQLTGQRSTVPSAAPARQ